jgi:hypothetical protein
MDYRYTDEDTLAVAVTITLAELDDSHRILNPIANEDDHEQRYRACGLEPQARTSGPRCSSPQPKLSATGFQRQQVTNRRGASPANPQQRKQNHEPCTSTTGVR